MVECAGLEIRYTVPPYRGFESLSLRQPTFFEAHVSMADARSKQITGNVGLYYCCYRLSLLGWNVMPTARNAQGVDIIAYNRDASRFVAIQVKTLSDHAPVGIGKSLDGVMGDFWVVVNEVASLPPSAFILLPSEVRELVSREADALADHAWHKAALW